jgi:hypothetical protein
MNSAQLLNIVENSVLNRSLNAITTHYSAIKYMEGITNHRLYFERNCDEIIIEGFEVDINNMNSIHDIELIIGGQIIVSINFPLLLDLTNRKSNKIYFPKNIIPPIQIVSLMNHVIYILVKGGLDIKYKLILKKKYYNHKIRQELATKYQEHVFNEFSYTYKFSCTNKINLSKNFGDSKGFYLKTYKKLNYIKFEYNNEMISKYDYDDIVYYFGKPNIVWKYTKEHKLLLYKLALPIEILKNINTFLDGTEELLYWLSIIPDNKPDSLEDTHINLTQGNFSIRFDNIYSGEITNVINNIFTMQNGFACLKFMN